MKVGEAFASDGKYLKADQFVGKRVAATIKSVQAEELDGKKKHIAYFSQSQRGLVLNVTNANMIAEIAGTDEMDNWGGVRIVLYGTKTDFQGKRVNAIRVDYPPSGQAAPPPPQPPPVQELTSEFMDDEEPPF